MAKIPRKKNASLYLFIFLKMRCFGTIEIEKQYADVCLSNPFIMFETHCLFPKKSAYVLIMSLAKNYVIT